MILLLHPDHSWLVGRAITSHSRWFNSSWGGNYMANRMICAGFWVSRGGWTEKKIIICVSLQTWNSDLLPEELQMQRTAWVQQFVPEHKWSLHSTAQGWAGQCFVLQVCWKQRCTTIPHKSDKSPTSFPPSPNDSCAAGMLDDHDTLRDPGV